MNQTTHQEAPDDQGRCSGAEGPAGDGHDVVRRPRGDGAAGHPAPAWRGGRQLGGSTAGCLTRSRRPLWGGVAAARLLTDRLTPLREPVRSACAPATWRPDHGSSGLASGLDRLPKTSRRVRLVAAVGAPALLALRAWRSVGGRSGDQRSPPCGGRRTTQRHDLGRRGTDQGTGAVQRPARGASARPRPTRSRSTSRRPSGCPCRAARGSSCAEPRASAPTPTSRSPHRGAAHRLTGLTALAGHRPSLPGEGRGSPRVSRWSGWSVRSSCSGWPGARRPARRGRAPVRPARPLVGAGPRRSPTPARSASWRRPSPASSRSSLAIPDGWLPIPPAPGAWAVPSYVGRPAAPHPIATRGPAEPAPRRGCPGRATRPAGPAARGGDGVAGHCSGAATSRPTSTGVLVARCTDGSGVAPAARRPRDDADHGHARPRRGRTTTPPAPATRSTSTTRDRAVVAAERTVSAYATSPRRRVRARPPPPAGT